MSRSQRHKVYHQGVASNGEIIAEGEINPLVKTLVLEYIEGGGGGEVPGTEPPTITTMSPLSGAVGSPDVTITVTGTGFAQGSAIMWNGAALATTFTDETSVSATAPVSQSATEGQVEVRVANGAEQSNPVYFTLTAAVP